MYITKQYALQVMNGLRAHAKRDSSKDDMRLSPRKRQIVRLLVDARTNREIAGALQISERTVKSYMNTLMGKLKARNRVEVAIAARRHEELELHDLPAPGPTAGLEAIEDIQEIRAPLTIAAAPRNQAGLPART